MNQATDHDVGEWVKDCVAHGAHSKPWPLHVLVCLASHDIGAPVDREVVRRHLLRNGYMLRRKPNCCHDVVTCALVYPDGRH